MHTIDAISGDEKIYYTARAFGDEGKIFHGFFGRNGGASKGIYDSLNLGRGSQDAPENVQHNFEPNC